MRVAQTTSNAVLPSMPTPPAAPVIGNSVLQASDTRDALGRVLLQSEYDTTAEGSYSSFGTAATPTTPGTVIYSEIDTFNNDSQLVQSNVSQIIVNANTGAMTNTVTATTNNYGYAVAANGVANTTSYADGNVISQTQTETTYQGASGTNSASTTTIDTSTDYLWFGAAEQGGTTSDYYGAQSGTTTATFDYDHNGHVSQVTTTGTNAHTNTYTESAAGLVMENQEVLQSGGNSAPETFYFYFNDKMIGQIGNNGTTNVNYTTSIDNQTTTTTSPGAFANGAGTGTASANFDENYYAVNATGNGENLSGGSYTVQSGDTLQSIAAAVYGDANLWYVIADANGLDAGSALEAGTILTLPNTVENAGNTASTFKPYNANEALGDVSPGAPVPPAQSGGGCGQIFVAILTAVLNVINPIGWTPVGAAIDSVAAQGVGILVGAQNSINWNEVAGAGINALSNILVGPFLGPVLSQGLDIATGLQHKFDFAALAEAEVAAAVTASVGVALDGGSLNASMQGPVDISLNTPINTFVSGVAGALAGAATRSVLTGTDFGTNVLAELPQVVGGTIGNSVEWGIAQSSDTAAQGQTGGGGGVGSQVNGPSNMAYGSLPNDTAVTNNGQTVSAPDPVEETGPEIVVTADRSERDILWQMNSDQALEYFRLYGNTWNPGGAASILSQKYTGLR